MTLEKLIKEPMDGPALTREELIFMWKTEGGNYSWDRWAKMHGIPTRNPEFIKLLTEQLHNRQQKETNGK